MKREMEDSTHESADDSKIEEEDHDDCSMEMQPELKSSMAETWYNSLKTQNSSVNKSTVGAS